jgi:Z1 domain
MMGDQARVITSPDTGQGWNPVIGTELTSFLEGKPADMRERLTNESMTLLRKCVNPSDHRGASAKRAGLVLGYVQSGKTLSFTAVTAAARDNGYKLVIVIAGTTTILQTQTVVRLTKDLNLDEITAYRRWSLIQNPASTNGQGQTLTRLLREHMTSGGDDFDLGVPLVVVMKQHTHLANLIELLQELDGMEKVAALVVDDEAHMHSPDVGKQGKESATYGQLKRLRASLPVHALLQYTATPQAPLLAQIADELSPDFVHVLKPGRGYCGGQYFCIDHHDEFVNTIPDSESYALDLDSFIAKGPPDSLRKAFFAYALTCAVSRFHREMDPSHSTMLVHPHAQTKLHAAWTDSIKAMRSDLLSILDASAGDPDRVEVMKELQRSLDNLAVPGVPSVEELIQPLKTVLRRIEIRKINSKTGKKNEIAWATAPYWILVGGNLLGVGFTVEGLRITHMMRSVGTRLTDSIQQRARFFGYKGGYAESCRAWMQPEVDAAFVDYVKHEEALRKSLTEFDATGKSLREWKRVFLLDPALKLTRAAASRLSLNSFKFDSEGWCIQQHFARSDADLFERNLGHVEEFVADLAFKFDEDLSGATDATRHDVATCSLGSLRSFLANFATVDSEAGKFVGLDLLLAAAVDAEEINDEQECRVINMGVGMRPGFRERAVAWNADSDAGGRAEQDAGRVVVHQGSNPNDSGKAYIGDAAVLYHDLITLQIHRVTLRDGANGPVIDEYQGLPFIAVSIPERLRTGIIYEPARG